MASQLAVSQDAIAAFARLSSVIFIATFQYYAIFSPLIFAIVIFAYSTSRHAAFDIRRFDADTLRPLPPLMPPDWPDGITTVIFAASPRINMPPCRALRRMDTVSAAAIFAHCAVLMLRLSPRAISRQIRALRQMPPSLPRHFPLFSINAAVARATADYHMQILFFLQYEYFIVVTPPLPAINYAAILPLFRDA